MAVQNRGRYPGAGSRIDGPKCNGMPTPAGVYRVFDPEEILVQRNEFLGINADSPACGGRDVRPKVPTLLDA